MKDKNIINFDNLPENYTSNYLQEGVEGTCFLLEDNQVFKRFKYEYDREEDLLRQSNIKSKSFIFPDKLIYVQDKLVGYTMPYIKGDMFSDINGQTDIKLFIYNLSSMEEVSKQLAKYHNLMTCDIHSGNLIVDKDSDIIVVDTTHFIFEEYNDPITTFRYNMKALANTVLYEIFKNIDIKDSRINQLYLNAILDGKCKPSYVLYETLRKLEIEMKSEVNTYEEFTQGLRLIKK